MATGPDKTYANFVFIAIRVAAFPLIISFSKVYQVKSDPIKTSAGKFSLGIYCLVILDFSNI